MASTMRRILDRISQRRLFFMAPQLEEFQLALKWPPNAKIVILPTHNAMVDNVIRSQFAHYGVVDVASSELSQSVAERLYDVSSKQVGALLYGYPNTPEEAHDLDLLLDGVNLAVHVKVSDRLQSKVQDAYQKCTTCGKVFNSSLPFITPTQPGFELDCEGQCNLEQTQVEQKSGNEAVMNYYAEKGQLFNLEIDEEHLHMNQKEFQQRLGDALIHAIKI